MNINFQSRFSAQWKRRVTAGIAQTLYNSVVSPSTTDNNGVSSCSGGVERRGEKWMRCS